MRREYDSLATPIFDVAPPEQPRLRPTPLHLAIA